MTALAMAAVAAAAEPPVPLEFHRVHVPAGRLGDVPLDATRRVPLPLADFEAAVGRAVAAAAGRAAAPTAACVSARWQARIDDSGRLSGVVACTVAPETAGSGRVLPLGGLPVGRGRRDGDPPREAVVCGTGAGLALVVSEPGVYELEFSCPPEAPGSTVWRLPLVPALASSLALDLPVGTRPVLSGPGARRAVVAPPGVGGGPWRIDVGPAADLVVAVVPGDEPPPSVAVWSDIVLRALRAECAAAVVPAGGWRAGRLALEQDAALRVTEVRAADGTEPLPHETTDDGRTLAVTVPRRLDGTRTPLVVRGVAPATGTGWRLPLLRAGAAGWAGGGAVVRVAPEFEVRDVELEDCRIVPPAVAAAWPTAEAADPGAAVAAGDGARNGAAILHLEQQGPAAAAVVDLGLRTATFDVARVTAVDISPGSVLGRVACDVRVAGGEAFEIVGRVAPGWIIDAVDAVERPPAGAAGGPAPDGGLVDWRVVPSPAGDALRIGLAFGAARRGGVGLRVSGHHAGLAPGAAFTTADVDMVRFEGEAADAAVLDLRTGPDAFVEIAGRPAGWFPLEGRLAALEDEGKARARIRAGDRAPNVEGRVVRRPPPLDVDVVVRLEPRDDALVQTFTFDCRAATGIESLVVDFAEPGGDGLAWRVESPADIGVTARRLGPGDGGLAARSPAVAASWLIELNPPASGPVRIRAARSVPFAAAVPVPLAWVEGAERIGGTVVIAAPPGSRPRLVNRLLREVPVDPAAAAAPAEYAYGAPAPAAAELVPNDPGSDARAWAWRERVSCRCETSGAVECESRFTIENEGRDAVSLALAPGRQVVAVLVDGVPPIGMEFGSASGPWRIPLPQGRRRLEVLVRTVAGDRARGPAWRVDPEGCSLDLPVLDRDVRLLLPPGLAVAAPLTTDPEMPTSWTARLFGVGAGRAAPESESAPGFRAVPVTLPLERGAIVVRRDAVTAAAILVALSAGIAAFVLAGRRPAGATVLAATAGVTALWLPEALMPVARAAWWAACGGLVAGLAATVRWRTPWPLRAAAATAVAVAVCAVPRPAVAAAGGCRVYVTPGDAGDVALVPEPLFRALAPFMATETAAIRVLECRITAGDAGAEPWRVVVNVDADAGGTLTLDCGPGARWLPPAHAGAVVAACAGREARLTAATAGRHTLELSLVPDVVRSGPVETATAWMPVAPIASLRVGGGDAAAGAIECERAAAAGAFERAPQTAGPGGPAFDVSAAQRVRIVRPVDPRDRLAAAARTADTVNDLAWDATACGVTATILLDAGPDLLRSFVVRTDPRLESLTATVTGNAPPRLVPLGDGRVVVELAEAARGTLHVVLQATLPLAAPVGVFAAPGAWVDGLPGETRTVRLASAPAFEALLDPPPPAGATAAELAARPPARVVVRRRRPEIRERQSLAASFAPTGVGLAFEARIDATDAALATIPLDVPVGCALDRVALDAEDEVDADRSTPVDVAWTRQAADRVLVVVQRPRPGRFRLEVEGRLARRPAQRGPLPVIRTRLGTDAPLSVAWTAEPPLRVAVREAGAAGPDLVEVPAGGPEPEYELTVAEAVPPRPAAPAVAAGPEENRVERAEVRIAIDRGGRVHGLARFDLVASGPAVRLRLPPGVRLFDVLVDGRVVAAAPRAADAWDVPLGVAPWPRTILAVFAGELAGTGDAGRLPAFAAPWLEGLTGPPVLWTLRPATGLVVTVEPPAQPLDAAAVAASREAAAARTSAACAELAAGAGGVERERLELLAVLRRADRGPVDEEAWRRAEAAAGGAAVVVALDPAEPLTIRIAPAADGTAPARALATVALAAVGGLAWTAARGRAGRRPG